MAAPGWYPVEGDPPGTVRRWNGVEWIGFPIPDPNAGPVGNASHKPSRLSRGGSILSILAMVSLTALAAVIAIVAARIWSDTKNLDARAASNDDVSLGRLDDYVENISTSIMVIALAVLVSGVIFVAWLRAAAAAAQVHRLKRPRGSALSRKRSTAEIVVQVWLFGLLAPIWWGIRSVLSDVSSGGNGNLFGVLSDTAMASSIDPKTGIAAIGPIKIVIWWTLWWGPLAAGIVAWVAMFILTPVAAGTLQTVLQLTVGLLALEVFSLVLIIVTIGQITARLTR